MTHSTDSPSKEQIEKLPKWARLHIDRLTYRAEHAELTLPWSAPGMEWFTLFRGEHDEMRIFTCDKEGTHPLFYLGRHDKLFVGRISEEYK